MSETGDCNGSAEFVKLICDFTKDVLTTYPEEADNLNENLRQFVIAEDIETIEESFIRPVWEHAKIVYPPRFFDILYQNVEMFGEESQDDVCFLPGIDFRRLWSAADVTEKTRDTIWKYLQLVLFCVVGKVWDDKTFGDTANLFEAIDEDSLKAKLEETVKQMEDMFKNQEQEEGCMDMSANINPDALPNPEDIHNHLSSLLKGKLGRLAQDIAEETATELGNEFGDIKSTDEVFKKLFRNPGKLMGLVKKVGGRLEDKIKSGEIQESELLKEASDFVTKMKDMPGIGNIRSMLGKMGIPDLGKDVKMNLGAMNGMMRNAQARDRMRQKLAKRRAEQQQMEVVSTSCVASCVAVDPTPDNPQQTLEFKKFSSGEKVEKSQRNGNGNDKKSKKPKKNKNKKK